MQDAGCDESGQVGRKPARQRRDREPHRAGDEHAATAEAVAQRPTEENQRGEAERVADDHPLQASEVGMQIVAEPVQRDVDDGRVERGPCRTRNGSGQHPLAGRILQAKLPRLRGHARYLKMLTARATTSATVTSEITDCNSMVNLAQRVSGITSVGLNAVAFVKEV